MVLSQIHSTSRPASVRSKALYCLSASLKHSASALEAFAKNDGWQALTFALEDPDITCRRKAAFLVDSLFSHSVDDFSTLSRQARQAGTIDVLLKSTGSEMKPFGADGDSQEDADLQEKSVRAVCSLNNRDSTLLSPEEKQQVRRVVETGSLDDAFAASEKDQILQQLSS